MQDNDPKHVSKQLAKGFLKTHKLTELPNANPIENLWHELKEFIRREVNRGTSENWLPG